MGLTKLAVLGFLLPLFFLEKSFAEVSTVIYDRAVVCNSTKNPSFCMSVLPTSGHCIYSYGRFSVARSLSQAKKFSRMLRRKLAKQSSLTQLAVRALEDCSLLADLNIDFLSTTGAAVNSSDVLLDPLAEEARALLSALLTNQQTCLEGLQLASSAWSLRNELSAPIANDTKLFSLSLALFSRAWVHRKKPRSNIEGGFVRGAQFFLTMSRRNREIFESAAGRRLLQMSSPPSSQFFVKTIVVVSKDQNGNFTSIGAAVASAPSNASSESGYYLIYVTAGVYEEYVVVPKNKKYVMLVGDGINRTIITGNRSVVDGWTTFNSATFGT